MLKAFIKIWLFVLLPLIVVFSYPPLNPIIALGNYLNTHYQMDNFRGTLYLLDSKLSETEPAQWPEQFNTLTQDFGYVAELVPLDQITGLPGGVESLRKGDVYRDESGRGQLLHLVPSSDWVIRLFMKETAEESMMRTNKGTIALLVNHLQTVSAEQWGDAITALQPNFGFDLNLINKMQLADQRYPLSAEKLEQLNRVGRTWLAPTVDDKFFYIDLPATQQVLMAGPISSAGVNQTFLTGSLLALFIIASIGLLLWLTPLWYGLRQLRAATIDFGRGQLKRRAKLHKNSLITQLGESFNGMAEKIEVLVDDHRDLTNALAHDLRTPLSKVRFALEMLESDDVNEESRQRYRDSIDNSMDALDYLINQMLTHSRYQRVADNSQFVHCDLPALLRREVDLFGDSCPQLSIDLCVAPDPALQQVMADKRALVRALDNLLSNAGRFACSVIVVELALHDGDIQLSVADDGPGIPAHERDKMIQPFAQSQGSERFTTGNHGLGLAIVHNIARWHQGRMVIDESTYGGAKVSLVWPAHTG